MPRRDPRARERPPEATQQVVLDVVERLRARDEEFVAGLLSELERHAAELLVDPEVVGALRPVSFANYHGGVDFGHALLNGRDPLATAGEPAQAIDHARLMARREVSLDLLLQMYRSAHAVVSEFAAEEILATGLAEPAQSLWLKGASRATSDYFDHLISFATEAYRDESERHARGHEQRLVRAVLRLLSGEPASSDDLGYRLEGHHLAMVVRGVEAESAARALGAAMGHEMLVVSHTDELAWLWLGSEEGFGDRAWERLRAHSPPGGVKVAVGESQAGVEGFRLSHRQAQTADRASLAPDRALTRYRDVALLAAVLEHDTARATFVATFLGELAGSGRRNETLRETLRAYFAAGHNARSAAAALGVDQRTVRHRVRTIEEMLGHPVDAHRAELEVALQLVEAPAGSPAET